MSVCYSLVCFDCKVELSFGKLYDYDENNHELEYPHMMGIRDWKTDEYHIDDSYFCECLTRFLVVHRNHELRFVPDIIDGVFEDDIGVIEEWMDGEYTSSRESGKDYDPYQETNQWKRRKEEYLRDNTFRWNKGQV